MPNLHDGSVRSSTVFADLATDLRHALRQYRRRPLFALLGVGTLALGLGATLALWSVVQGLVLARLPVADEERLQVFWSDYDWRGAEFDFVKERIRAFDGLAAYSSEGYTMRLGGESSLLIATVASADLFDVLGVRPLLGRTFAPGEDRPGAAPVMVLSYGLWQQELGGDPNVIGRQVEIDGAPATVIGVMPRGFYFPTPEYRAWRPLDLDPATESYHGNGWLVLVGRVRQGAAEGEVAADVQAIAKALGERFTYPQAWDKTKGAHVTPLREYTVGDVRPALLLLLGAVTLVLLIACANVAALMLARTTDRAPELALRAALGAGRGRLLRQIVTESLALSVTAGALGAALAAAGFGLLVRALPLRDGLEAALTLDWNVLGTALALALGVGLLVAAAPARALIAGRVATVTGERSATGLRRGPAGLHRALVAAEVALAVLLVAGATMLVRSVAKLYRIDAGFDPQGVVTLTLFTPTGVMPPAARIAFYEQAAERVAGLPGVRDAGFVTRLPLRDGGWQGTVTIEDRPDLRDGKEPNSYFRIVTPGYFAAMGIAIRAGRGFTAQDRSGTLPAGIVSESFAAKMWPGRDPIGRRVSTTMAGSSGWITVVGVAEETRLMRMTGENPIVLYVPLTQVDSVPEGQILVVRTAGLSAPIPAIRALVRELDSRVAVARIVSLDDVVAASLAEPLRLRFFLSIFGALALLLGAVGVYGVVSYSVTRRRSEFGVRMALGAAPRRIVAEVLSGGLAPVGLGVALGLLAGLALGRVLPRFLYGVTPTDAMSLLAAAGAVLGAGALATAVPGFRASRVNPVNALRTE